MRKICAAMAALLLLSSVAFGAEDAGVIVSGGMVVGLDGDAARAERVEIPAQSGGAPVEIIYRMNSVSLKEAALPPSVKTVYSGAFVGCPALERINLENVTTVFDRAFEGCPYDAGREGLCRNGPAGNPVGQKPWRGRGRGLCRLPAP